MAAEEGESFLCKVVQLQQDLTKYSELNDAYSIEMTRGKTAEGKLRKQIAHVIDGGGVSRLMVSGTRL